MNKKAWNSILNLFFVVFALAIIFVMYIYSTTEIQKAQEIGDEAVYNSTAFYNSTVSAQGFYGPGQALIFTMFIILTLAFIMFIIGVLIKLATNPGG